MSKLFKKYIILTDTNRVSVGKRCDKLNIIGYSQRPVSEMINTQPNIKVIGFNAGGYVDYSTHGTEAYITEGFEEITIEDLQPTIKKKFIFITSANREFVSKYCESMGLKTRSGRTARTLLDKGVEVIAFKEDGHLDYSQMGLIQSFLDEGYDEITSCELSVPLPKDPLPQDDEVVVVVEDKVPTPLPCKREMIIKLNEMYNTRDSLDLVIEQTEQLLKNVL